MWGRIATLTRLVKPTVISQLTPVLAASLATPRIGLLRSYSVFSNLLGNVLRNPGISSAMLQVPSVTVNPERGFKVKGRMRRRCKDCYFIRRHERLMVLCKTHPRHKQMAMQKRPHNTWIHTDATQGKQRAW